MGTWPLESEFIFVDDYSIKGYRKTSGWAKDDPVWFTAKVDQYIIGKKIIEGEKTFDSESQRKKPDRFLDFGPLSAPLNVKWATRSEGADENLTTLDAGLSFEEVKNSGKKYGNKLGQSRLKVQIRMFWKTSTRPCTTVIWHLSVGDTNGHYRSMNGEIKTRIGNSRYSAYSLWDVLENIFKIDFGPL